MIVKMKIAIVCTFLSLCVFAESGLVLDALKTGLADAHHHTKCNLHKLGGVFVHHRHENNPCEPREITYNHIDHHEKPFETRTSTTPVPYHKNFQTSTIVTDVVTSGSDKVTVPGGRSIIAVGSNCPEGYRSDGRGRCREEY